MLKNKRVLVLNSAFEPIRIIKAKNALCKLIGGSTSFYVEAYYDEPYVHFGLEFKVPSVIRLKKYIHFKKALGSAHTGRKKKIFERDRYKCVYCGYAGTTDELTLDHVIPKSKGGDSTNHNLVTSCRLCNNKKGDKSLEEMGYRLNKGLLAANVNLAALIGSASEVPEWKPYLFI